MSFKENIISDVFLLDKVVVGGVSYVHQASLQLLFQLTTVTHPLWKLPEGGLFQPPEVAVTTGSRELTLTSTFLLHSKSNFSKQFTWYYSCRMQCF